jgi:tetratricopeptide (TPR) repeat protein
MLLGFFIYGNSFNNKLFLDDYSGIVNNTYIKDWKYFPKYFTESLVSGAGGTNNYWRPLVTLSFSVDYKIGKLNPFFYHFQNLLWHIIAATGVFILAREFLFSKKVSFLGALFFLIHPLQTEAVAYISGRAEPMYFSFFLWSFLFFIKYSKNKKVIRKFWMPKEYAVSLGIFLLGFMVKERMVVLLPILLAYIFLFERRVKIHKWYRKYLAVIPFAAIAIVYFILRSTVINFPDHFVIDVQTNMQELNIYQQLIIYLKMFSVSVQLIFFPNNLHMFRTINLTNSFVNWDVIAGIFGIVGWGVLMCKEFSNKKIFFMYLWITITILPSLVTFRMHGYFGEHWLYGILPGVFLLIFYYIEKRVMKNNISIIKVIVTTGIVLLAGVYSYKTVVRNKEWKEPIDFYEVNIKRGGVSAIAYNNLGMAYYEKQRIEEAEKMYVLAISLNPEMYQAWYNLGNIYLKSGDYEKALEYYRRAIDSNDKFFLVYHNIAVTCLAYKKCSNEFSLLDQAITIFPKNKQLLYDLAKLCYTTGEKERAFEYIKMILKISPDDKFARSLLK